MNFSHFKKDNNFFDLTKSPDIHENLKVEAKQHKEEILKILWIDASLENETNKNKFEILEILEIEYQQAA